MGKRAAVGVSFQYYRDDLKVKALINHNYFRLLDTVALHLMAFFTGFRPPQGGLGTLSAHAPARQLPNAALSGWANSRKPARKVGKRAAAGVIFQYSYDYININSLINHNYYRPQNPTSSPCTRSRF